MLRLPAFNSLRAESIEDVIQALSDSGGNARILAGGTDLLPNLKRGLQPTDLVISLSKISALRGIAGSAEKGLEIGPMTPLVDIAKDPTIAEHYAALAAAAASVAGPAIRNMATLGGNLCLDTRCDYYDQSESWRKSIGYCMKACGDVCHTAPKSTVCRAVNSADCPPALIALGAEIQLVSSSGKRTVPLEELYLDDGDNFLNKKPDELITKIILPPARGLESSFVKLRRRGAIDFPLLNVAVALQRDAQGTVQAVKLILGAVGSMPRRAAAAEALIVGQKLTDKIVEAAAAATRKSATPFDNTDFSARWRGKMVVEYTKRALMLLVHA
jgi:4-hydroxybenzoyl-CoA reductase subunit beta